MNQAYDMVLYPGADYHLVNKLQSDPSKFLRQAIGEARKKYAKYISTKHSNHNIQTERNQHAFSEAESSLRNFINSYSNKMFTIFTTLHIKQVRIMSCSNHTVLDPIGVNYPIG